MKLVRTSRILIWMLVLYASLAGAQGVTLTARVAVTPMGEGKPAESRDANNVLVWLTPVGGAIKPVAFRQSQPARLVQKNKSFDPHLLVVPVGSVVAFPNHDPFFHNVFSLFEGKRFDLGLYEAGSTRDVHFDKPGIAYIFCNIHPEMSAVVLTLSTSLYSVADSGGGFHIARVPQGEYELHVWIEGVAQPLLNRMVRRVHVAPDSVDLGVIEAPAVLLKATPHTNMYGQPYDRNAKTPY